MPSAASASITPCSGVPFCAPAHHSFAAAIASSRTALGVVSKAFGVTAAKPSGLCAARREAALRLVRARAEPLRRLVARQALRRADDERLELVAHLPRLLVLRRRDERDEVGLEAGRAGALDRREHELARRDGVLGEA